MPTIKIDKIHSDKLIEFIKKSAKVSNSLYINIDSEKIYTNIYDSGKTIVKCIKYPVSDVFEGIDLSEIEGGPLKMSFYDHKKVLSSFNKPFKKSDKISGGIVCSKDADTGSYMAEKFGVSDGKVKMKLACSDPATGFVDLDENTLSNVFKGVGTMFDFYLMKKDMEKLHGLMDMDSDEQINLKTDEKGVYFGSSTFDITVDEEEPSKKLPEEALLLKDTLKKTDVESYNVIVHQDRMFLHSDETETEIALLFANKG